MGDDDGAYLTDSRWQAQDNRSMVVKSGEGGGGRRIVMSFSGSSSWMPSTSGNFWWFSLLLSALRFHIVVIIIIMGKTSRQWSEAKEKNSCELVDGWKVEEKSQTTRALINSKITYRLTKSSPLTVSGSSLEISLTRIEVVHLPGSTRAEKWTSGGHVEEQL